MTDALVRPDLGSQAAYLIRSCTEGSDPSLVAEALRIHAAGYLSMGFLNGEAVTEEGFIHPDIDRSRGETTEYFLAVNSTNAGDCATLRKVRLRPGASMTDFDCYELCRRSLFPEGAAHLARMFSEAQAVVEISALARTPQASPATVWHLLRAAVHDSMARKEVWFFCLVVSTYDSFVSHLGPSFMSVLGRDVAIEDGRVSSDVMLRPVMVDTTSFIDSMLLDYEGAAGRTRSRLERSLLFFSEGLDEKVVSPAAAAFRGERAGENSRPPRLATSAPNNAVGSPT